MTVTKDGSPGSSVVAGPWPGSAEDADSPQDGQSSKETFWNISYSYPLRPFGGSIWVNLLSNGQESTLSLTANWRGRQEIGFYSGLLPADRSEAVRTLVQRSDFARHAHHGNIAPDTPYTSLGYNPSGEASEIEIFVSQPPAPVAAAMNAIEDLAEEIRKHAYLVIAGSAAWNQPRFRVGDALELTVTLRSVGEKAVTFDNPLGSTDPGWTSLRMRVAADKPDDKLDWEREVAADDKYKDRPLLLTGAIKSIDKNFANQIAVRAMRACRRCRSRSAGPAHCS